MVPVRRSLGFSLLLLSASACRGPSGDPGAPGADGPPGGHAEAPRILHVEPATFSWGVTVRITGIEFAPDPARVKVYVDGVEGEIVSATSTLIRVRHLVPADLSAAEPGDLVVVSDNQPSNPIRVEKMPRGSTVNTPLAAIRAAQGFAVRGDGSLLVLDGGRLVDVTSDGDLGFHAEALPADAAAPVSRPDGTWYLARSPNELRRFGDMVDQRVAVLPAGDPRALAFDALGNAYVLMQDVTQATIVKRDYLTGALTTPATLASTDVQGLWEQGDVLYAGDVAAGALLEIPIATFVPAPLATITARSITGNGLDTLYVYDGGRVQEVATADGMLSDWTLLSIGATADEIDRGEDGTIWLRAGNVIWRMPDATTLESFAAALEDAVVAPIAGVPYAGSSASCGQGDSAGGVLYEVQGDGRMRSVLPGFCPADGLTYSQGTGRLLYVHALTESLMELDPFAGTEEPLVTFAAAEDPRMVVSGADGTIYVANTETGSGQRRISSFAMDGTPASADFVPVSAEDHAAGAVFGADLVLFDAASGALRAVPAAGGGASGAYGPEGFQPVDARLSVSFGGNLLVSDPGQNVLWGIGTSGVAVRLADVENAAAPFFDAGDGRLITVGNSAIEAVLP